MSVESHELLWALVTLLLTGIVGLVLLVGLLFVLQRRTWPKWVKQWLVALGFLVFVGWLFTMGDPAHRWSIRSLYEQHR